MPLERVNPSTVASRTDEDDSPTSHALATTMPRRSPERSIAAWRRDNTPPPGTPADGTDDWYRRLGASHRRRDESARLTARAIEGRDRARRLSAHARWPAIVGAMRALIARYNDGAGSEIVSLNDAGPSHDGAPTTTVTARNGDTLVMALEDDDVRVRASRDDHGRTNVEQQWIGLNRTDEAMAAYVLQNWLARLGDGDAAAPATVRAPVEDSDR